MHVQIKIYIRTRGHAQISTDTHSHSEIISAWMSEWNDYTVTTLNVLKWG